MKLNYLPRILSVLLGLFCVISTSATSTIEGELQKWHRVTLLIEGPELSELGEENPFLDYRLDVDFTHKGETFTVPGFFAADGNAADSGSEKGNVWKVHFTPNSEGQWSYRIRFKKGESVAVRELSGNEESASDYDGKKGSFRIHASDKQLPDNRAKGRLQVVGGHYLQWAETGTYFIKVGVDAPENLLAYSDFDATPNVGDRLKTWSYHSQDFQQEAESYLWKDQKGKNLMGAIHYLYSEDLNVFSFLTFNVDGDDRNVFPHLLNVPKVDYEAYSNENENLEAFSSLVHKTRFDVSKLEQWGRVFEYAETLGMFLHFKTNETETDHLMDNGAFGVEGKLYYRELIARFGHHLALNWNLGEENNQPIWHVREVAKYVAQLDPYDHHIVLHTFPNEDDRYAFLVGEQSELTGASLQLRDPEFVDVHDRVLKWRAISGQTKKPWPLAVDEPGKANIALLPDAEDPEHHLARARALWGTLMAGGYGVEWYFGYQSPHSDLTCEDFRSRDLFWDQNRIIKSFFENHLSFWKMEPRDELTKDGESYCFAEEDSLLVVYLHPGQVSTSIWLGESESEYSIQWFDPRDGGPLQQGSLSKTKATGWCSVGNPPKEDQLDWVVLIKRLGE